MPITSLRFDPFQIFKHSRTPAGLYARKKWLDQGRDKGWQNDYDQTTSELLQGQSPNGSWKQSAFQTIRRLFGLHLTVRDRTEAIEKSLHWLLGSCTSYFPKKRVPADDRLPHAVVENLPFSMGCSGYFLYGATLFLSSIFGMEKDPRVFSMYQSLAETGVTNEGRWCGLSCSNNILRAFVVHPDFSSHQATQLAVTALAREQQPSGLWKRPIPFFQTVNALAHLNVDTADAQLHVAFRRLWDSQNRDGTWGRTHKEWNTFLVIHALKNKGHL
ncbi:MAG: hypothetical protein JRL30_08585 [Deltaproteobacteria bacterium]|nr:hypothetical protein [Deltaproteobacteria bacterium]